MNPQEARVASNPVTEAFQSRTRLQLAGLAGIAGTLLVVLYILAVRTRWGQRLDAAALRGRGALRPRAIHAAGQLLTTISIASLALLGTAIILFAVISRRNDLAAAAALLIVGACFTTEVLKHVVLPRPFLGIVDGLGLTPSFPSGHTTVAMSLAVAAILVVPPSRRGLIAVAAVLYPSAIGVAVIATGNHRPSDAIGAVLVVLIWAALACGWLVVPQEPTPEPAPTKEPAIPLLALGGIVLLTVAFVGLVTTTLTLRRETIDTVELGAAFLASAAAVTGSALVAVAVLLAALRPLRVSPESRGTDTRS